MVHRFADRHFPWLTLCGKSGRGKTHLAERVAAFLKAKSIFGGRVLWRWIDVLSIGRSGDSQRIAAFMNRMDDNKAVIIDDFGAGHETAFSAALLGEIAERRLKKHTMFTTNLSIGQIASEIDTRIASRMRRDGSQVFTFEKTPDYDL